ncbi:MAG: hypothetical protein ACE5L6_04970 [Candidatus Bathyarchaeia archaeon]
MGAKTSSHEWYVMREFKREEAETPMKIVEEVIKTSHKIIAKTALKRQKTFRNLNKHLQTIKETITKLDSNAEAYLLGLVAENRHIYSSNIDILIVTKAEPARIDHEL